MTEGRSVEDLGNMEGDEENEVVNLNQQLAAALFEKERALELYHMTRVELEHTAEHSAEVEQSVEQRERNVEQAVKRVRDQYEGETREMRVEMERMRDELERVRGKLRSEEEKVKCAMTQREEISRSNRQLVEEMKRVKDEMEMSGKRMEESDGGRRRLEEERNDLVKEVEMDKARVRDGEIRTSELMGELDNMRSEIGEVRRREKEMGMKMRENIELVERVEMEREECVVREQQQKRENLELHVQINKLISEASTRTREEVNLVRQHVKSDVEKVEQEVRRLTIQIEEKDVELRRMQKERERMAESGSECGGGGGRGDESRVDALYTRLSTACKQRDEAEVKLGLAETEMHEMRDRMERIRMDREKEGEERRNQVVRWSEELKLANNERERLLHALNGADSELRRYKIEVERWERKDEMRRVEVENVLEQERVDGGTRWRECEERWVEKVCAMEKRNDKLVETCEKWRDECGRVRAETESKMMEQRRRLRTCQAELKSGRRKMEMVKVQLGEHEGVAIRCRSEMDEIKMRLKESEMRLEESEMRLGEVKGEDEMRRMREEMLLGEKKHLEEMLEQLQEQLITSLPNKNTPK